MKTATLPPLRVEPELRKSVERLLVPGETVSTFVERAVRDMVERRQADETFGERALAARARAQATGRYRSAADVLGSLRAQVKAARPTRGRRR